MAAGCQRFTASLLAILAFMMQLREGRLLMPPSWLPGRGRAVISRSSTLLPDVHHLAGLSTAAHSSISQDSVWEPGQRLAPNTATTGAGHSGSSSSRTMGERYTDHLSSSSTAAPSGNNSNSSLSSHGVQAFPTAADAVQITALSKHANLGLIGQDVHVLPQAMSCADVQRMSSGIQSSPPSAFRWPGCRTGDTKLVWAGQRCTNNMQRINYTAIYALVKATNTIANSASTGQPCIMVADGNDKQWTRRFFGAGCAGVAPPTAPQLPTLLCAVTPTTSPCLAGDAKTATGTITATITLSDAVTCAGSAERVKVLKYTGRSCGPGNAYIEWLKAQTVSGCIITPNSFSGTAEQTKFRLDVFGACGSNPGLMARAVSPANVKCSVSTPESSPGTDGGGTGINSTATGPVMPKTDVKEGERIPVGVQRIEAAAGGKVADLSRVAAAGQVVVGVVDSGIEKTHPDLHYLDGKSWVDATQQFPYDNDPGADYHGHGTMVAGIVGALNTGSGVVGVSPGISLFSLKVANGNWFCLSSRVVLAVQWAATEGRKLGIRVLNLSLDLPAIDPAKQPDTYKTLYDLYCPIMKQADDAGILVVVAAGNGGVNLKWYLPAACPNVVAVTGMIGTDPKNSQPSETTNYLPADATDAEKARVIAGPGMSVESTAPMDGYGGYNRAPGTSFAAPHVAAVAANCLLSGACPDNSTGSEILAMVQAAAVERASLSPRFGFRGDPDNPDPMYAGRYYGRLVWSKW